MNKMKKAIFTLALLAAMTMAMQSNAQEKGRLWVGGSIGFGSNETGNSDNSQTNTFSLAPEVGYNFSDRWGAGLRFGVATAGIKHLSDGTKSDFRNWSVAPFARYNFVRWKAITLFADGGLIYSAVDNELWEDNGYSNATQRHGGIFVDPGVSLRLSRHLSLVARMNIFTAGYTTTTSSSTSLNGLNETHSWAASLNSPFDIDGFLDSFTLGFNLTF